MRTGVVFLDRDGVINVEGGYLDNADDWRPLPGALEAIAALHNAGWKIIVYTNQSGVGRGYMTEDALDVLHQHLLCEVAKTGGHITAIYACVHAPDAGCDCRKPKPGMLLQAARDHGIDLNASFAVGDSPRDIAAGHAAGCRTVLVLTGHARSYSAIDFPDPQPGHVFPTLTVFTDWLLTGGI